MTRPLQVLYFAAALLLSGCMRWGDETSEEALRNSFKEVIGFDQPASVKNSKSSYYWVRDSYIRWLYFECDDALLAQLRLSGKNPRNFTWGDSDRPGSPGGNVNAPKWWKDGSIGRDLEQIDIDRSQENNSDYTHIWIDKKRHAVFASRDVNE